MKTKMLREQIENCLINDVGQQYRNRVVNKIFFLFCAEMQKYCDECTRIRIMIEKQIEENNR